MILAATPTQTRIINALERFIANIAGRRVGKTIGVCRNRIIKRGQIPGFHYMFITPSYPQLKSEFEALVGSQNLAPHIAGYRRQPPPEINWLLGGRTWFRSFDRAKNIRGSGENEVWGDEIQDYNENDFWAVVRPLISDLRGTLGVSGQLRGKNWVWDQFVIPGLVGRYVKEILDGPKGRLQPEKVTAWANDSCYGGRVVVTPDEIDNALRTLDLSDIRHAAWITPSTEGLRFRDEAGRQEIEDARNSMLRSIFEQEYLCVPTAGVAGVFRPEDLDACRNGEAKSGPDSGRPYVLSIDLGRVADPTAMLILDAKSNTAVYEEVRPLGTPHAENARHAAALRARWNKAVVVIDTTGGATGGHAKPDEFVKHYQQSIPDMHRIYWEPRVKREMIEGLVLALEQRAIHIPGALRITHRELQAYTYSVNAKNQADYHAPAGMHDDCVAALAMAWYAVKRGFISSSIQSPSVDLMLP